MIIFVYGWNTSLVTEVGVWTWQGLVRSNQTDLWGQVGSFWTTTWPSEWFGWFHTWRDRGGDERNAPPRDGFNRIKFKNIHYFLRFYNYIHGFERFVKIYTYRRLEMRDLLFSAAWSRETDGRNNPTARTRMTASVPRAGRARPSSHTCMQICVQHAHRWCTHSLYWPVPHNRSAKPRGAASGPRDRRGHTYSGGGIVPAVGLVAPCREKQSVAHFQPAVRVYFHKSFKTMYIIVKT